MSLTFSAPGALWLLLALPLVWIAPRFARTRFSPPQRRIQAVLRTVLLGALVFAMARPVISGSSAQESIVYAVDVSHSVSGRAIEAAAGTIDELNAAIRPAHSRVVAFGSTAMALKDSEALRRLARTEPGEAGNDDVDRRGTDLEAGLDAARAELAPGHVPRVVLFSDGRPTAGDVSAAIARLAAGNVPVGVQPLAPRSLGDAWVDALDVPDTIIAGAPFVATVTVASQKDQAATVELRSADKVLSSRPVLLVKGLTPVTMEASVDAAGASVLQAAIAVPGDPLEINNTLDHPVWAGPHAQVLYVEGTPASAHYLSGALTTSGFDVTVRPASQLPTSIAALDPWDVVILSDVARASISDPAMAALTEWVEDGGGGLLFAGGEAVFGEGGYRKTALERLSPVTFERRDDPEVALILVLDRSLSMAGTSMELCKAAAQAAVNVMTDEQSIGVITFNDRFSWEVTLRNVGKNRDNIREKIAGIGPGGQTLIFPALEQAYIALRSAKARAKHVVLLSDGRTYPDDYEGLVRKMNEAKITVSSVAVGPSSDPELLRNIANWGKGRSYVVADARELPQIFVKEAKNALTPGFDEKEITPIVKAPAFLTGVDLAHIPHLKGRTATALKDTALELLATEDDDPLLAFWPVGLGRAAVFASDVKDRWAAEWIKWRGYGPFFTAVVRAVQRQRPAALSLEVAPRPIRGRTRSIDVAVEARDGKGQYQNMLHPVVRVQQGTGAPAELTARQVAPGRYEATILADAALPVSVTLTGDEAGGASRLVLPDGAAEYRFRQPDEALLKSIAAATRGAWMPTPTSLGSLAGDYRTDRRPIWPALLALALLLWLVDLVLRRVRIFEEAEASS
jgi:uncharacterized membrane protein/uncharacterized protein YegL